MRHETLQKETHARLVYREDTKTLRMSRLIRLAYVAEYFRHTDSLLQKAKNPTGAGFLSLDLLKQPPCFGATASLLDGYLKLGIVGLRGLAVRARSGDGKDHRSLGCSIA